jgi:excisionase family DNA binding protein
MMENKLMTVDEVAAYVRLTSFTVRRLAKKGALPAAKIGRAYRFKPEDINAYMREQCTSANNAA